MIYARNEETGEVGLKRVKRTLGGKAHTIYTIGMGEYGIIQSTNYHRYYVEEKGWVSAIQLQVGDYLCTIEGEHVEITSIEKERQEEGVAVYNFVVEDWESYFVSKVGVYVHNDPCDPTNGKSFKDMMSPEEAKRYDDYWKQNAPDFNTPNSKITHYKEHNGVLEKSTVFYDDFGRQKWRIDYSNHGYDNHSIPHLHERVYSPGFDPRKGKETRYDIWR